MSLASMTGFGRSEVSSRGIKVLVELNSVNRKQFDVRLNLPRWLLPMESKIHKLAHASISRGQINGVVRASLSERKRSGSMRVNSKSAATILMQVRKLALDLNLPDDLSARAILDIPNLVEIEEHSSDLSKLWPVVKRAVCAALDELVNMRKIEGKALQVALKKYIGSLNRIHKHIEGRVPRVMRDHQRSLEKRIKEIGLDLITSDVTLTKEIVFCVERANINEELVRLQSHFVHAQELIDSHKPCGRPLDFLCQEMFREINTISAKSSDSVISRDVIRFKTELENIREQVQNIE